MTRIGHLPTSLTVNGTDYPINSDFRVALNILQAMADPELDAWRKVYVCLYWLYDAFEAEPDAPLIMPPEDYDAAYKAACEFLEHGSRSDRQNHPALMDWDGCHFSLLLYVCRSFSKHLPAWPTVYGATFIHYIPNGDRMRGQNRLPRQSGCKTGLEVVYCGHRLQPRSLNGCGAHISEGRRRR